MQIFSIDYSNLRAIQFAITLFGYGAVSFLVKDVTLSQTVTIPYRAVVLIASIAVIVYEFKLLQPRSAHRKNPSHKRAKPFLLNNWFSRLAFFALIAFIVLYSAVLLFDIFKGNFQLVQANSDYLLNWFGICLFPSISLLYIDKSKPKTYLAFSFVLLLLACLLAFQIDTSHNAAFENQGRLSNPALNPISLGHAGVTLALFSIHLYLSESVKKTFRSFLYLSSASLGILTTFLAASRGPLISLIVCVFIFFVGAALKSKKNMRVLLLVVFAFFAISFLSDIASSNGSQFIERLLALTDGTDSSAGGRTLLFDQAIKTILGNLTLGYAIELPGYGYPHNLFVESFLATGIFGGISFLIIYSYALFEALKIIFSGHPYISRWKWLALLYIQYAIGVMFSGSLYASSLFWYSLFSIFSLSSYIHTSNKRKLNESPY